MNKRVLHWSYRDYKIIPDDLLQYDEYLEEVYLKENFITYLPQWLFQMTNLKFLQLSGNTLKKLPIEIYLLENLEFLDISNNKLQYLPQTIGKLKKLEYFNVSGNCIVSIPTSIGGLRKLESLDMGANLFYQLPIEVSQCCRLRNVTLNDNVYLQSIPEAITNLPHLESFCADRCGLLYLPALLSKFLSYVRVFNNQYLTHIPISYEKHITSYYDIFYPPYQRTTYDSTHFWIKELENNTILLISFGTRNIHSISSKIPFSLYDSCLKIVYKYFTSTTIKNENLPENIKESILNGPIVLCSLKNCSKNIFSEYYLILVKTLNSTGRTIFSCSFCSIECAQQWLLKNKFKYYVVDWMIL